jgi:hypothetical protein
MSTVVRKGSIIFFFTSYDCIEPIHIHIVDGNKECKFWLLKDNQTELADNHGFSKIEITKLTTNIKENFTLIKNTWNEHCKNSQDQKFRNKGGK